MSHDDSTKSADSTGSTGSSPTGRGPTKRHIGIQMTALGLEFSASVIGGMIGGWWLDGYFGTKPWLFLLGTFAGLGTSLLRIIQLSRQFDRARDDDSE